VRELLVLVGHDLRQHLRDRSVLLFALVIPLSLSAVFTLAFGGVTDLQVRPVTVAVAVPPDDPVAEAVPTTLEGLADQGVPVSVRSVPADQAAALLADGAVAVAVVVPDGFGAAVGGGTGARVEVTSGDDAGLAGVVVTGVVESTVRRLDGDARAVAAAARLGLDPAGVEAVAGQVGGAAPQPGWSTRDLPAQQLSPSAGIVAGQAGMFLFFTVGFAVLTLLTEREWGTLARLRTMPLRPWLVPAAKAVVGVLLGVASTTVLLVSGQLLFAGVDFGSWPVVMVLVVATVIAATSVMALILKLARTAEQASLALSVIAITLGVTGGTFFQVPSGGVLGQLLMLNPVAALTRGLGLTAGGGGVADLTPVLLTLGGFTAAALLLARFTPGRADAL
jgi:ABC-2 type transport system permease protein